MDTVKVQDCTSTLRPDLDRRCSFKCAGRLETIFAWPIICFMICRAVADYHSSPLPFELTAEDVCIAVGCSQAIQLCVAALATAGANMLIPRPGFPIYETFCKYYGVECRHYDLIPERDWEVDLDQVAALADENTAAWFVCNPSNPCGSVYKYQHLAKVGSIYHNLFVADLSHHFS